MYYVKDCVKGLRYWFGSLGDAQAKARETPDHLAGYLEMSHPEMRDVFHYDGECEDLNSPSRYVAVRVPDYGYGIRTVATGRVVSDERGPITFRVPMNAVLMAKTMNERD